MGLKETDKENSGEGLQVYDVKNSPFKKIGDDKGGFLAIGQYRLTEGVLTNAEIKKVLGTVNWEFMLNVISMAIVSEQKIKEEGL